MLKLVVLNKDATFRLQTSTGLLNLAVLHKDTTLRLLIFFQGQWRHEWISLKTSCSKSHLAFSPRCKRISDSHWALASTFPWLILRIFFLQDCPATLKNGKYYVSYALFTLTTTKVAKVVYKYFIAFNTHLPIKIFSPYFVDFLVLIWVALSTILFISSAG